MKRMIAFFILVLMLLCVKYLNIDKIKEIFGYDKIIVTTNQSYADLSTDYIKSGDFYYYKLDKEKGKEFLKNKSRYKIEGISFYFDKKYDLDYFKRIFDNNLTNGSQIENLEVYYGFYKNFDDYKMIDGKKINVQIAKTEEEWVIGMPFILTGF